MSDISHGPDWWQDGEGKWHPPHVKKINEATGVIKNFATAPDFSEEINEENIANHFQERYGWESQSEEVSKSSGNPKSKGWVPSRGDTGTGFMYPTTPADLFSGGLGILGAVLLISGSFISWATAGGSLTSNGIDAISDSNGIGTLITGALCGVCSMLLLNGQRKRWVGLLFSIIAVVALILTVYSIADIINTSDGIPNNLIERFPSIDPAYANKAKLDLGTGVWLALGGSVASLFAGISGFKRNA